MFCLLVFFFNDPATTEIYTYVHTLSLHDSRPIFLIPTEIAPQQGGPVFPRCLRLQIVWITGTNAPCYQGQCISFIPALRPQQRGLHGNLGDDDLLPKLFDKGTRCLRSDEHTSELQSLMRISYAVFCLQKKKTH